MVSGALGWLRIQQHQVVVESIVDVCPQMMLTSCQIQQSDYYRPV